MAETESYQQNKLKKYFLRILEEKLAFIVLLPLLAILITAFVFHFYRVDGISMEKTFNDDDFLVVEKLGKTTASIFRKDYVPKRYDVIVFQEPDYSPDEEIVKRVVGLPGDTIAFKQDKVIVYNKQNPQGMEVGKNLPWYAKPVSEEYTYDQDTKIKVTEGHVFVLGDNRPHSDDSRVFGPVDTKNITGRVIIRLLPLNKALIL
ncbi:MAG TPA: signal peptidase I [Candidatus Saccharimonadales bacterium]|nr:signal peptidase I [Candidatus Saccharimonadales bacterium]